MKLRVGLRTMVVVAHLGFGAAIVVLARDRPRLALGLEALILASLVLQLIRLRRMVAPLRLLGDAVDLLRASDFATRLRPTGHDDLDGLADVYNRMADRLWEERLRATEQEHLLQNIEAVSPVGMVALDHDGKVARLNPAAAAFLGVDPEVARGQSLPDLTPDFAARVAAMAPGTSEVFHLDGRRRWRVRRIVFLDRGFDRSFLLIDELTQELRDSEKAAYGRLIRMMAHEVNNTTGSVGSLLESCRSYAAQLSAGDREDFDGALDVALRRTRHMNDFMAGFADVVRLGPPSRRMVSLPGILDDLQRLTQVEREKLGIDWRSQLEPGAGVALGLDPVQMEQALLNVVRNAMQAIGKDGTIEVALRTEGRRTVLEIFDDGEGIDEERSRSLFTPFFTTRPQGQGIGLTLVQEILLGHGCEFSLGAYQGRTRFRVEFGGRAGSSA